MKAVTIDQLRVFRQVAESGSFSAAARHMHRAQSAVTYAVQKLEDQVGTPLFDRGGYRPVLSEAGRAPARGRWTRTLPKPKKAS